jgi:tetratricopeptide (TPR) repeat protein
MSKTGTAKTAGKRKTSAASTRPSKESVSEKPSPHIAVIVSLSLLAFWNSLGGAFVWDDEIQILKNPTIRDLSNLPAAFTSAFWAFLGPAIQNQTNYYRPFQTLTYMLAYAFGGLAPFAFHAFNLALHITACVFVYLLACELLGSRTNALIVSALFAVHPIHTEAVDWIAGVADVACGTFYFASFWAFLKYRRSSQTHWQWISCGLFLGALFCKEMAITLPLCILILQAVKPEYRLKWRENIMSVSIFAIAVIIYVPARIHALGVLATSQMKVEATWLDWAGLAVRAFAEYLRYMVLPYPLKAFHMLPVHLADTTVTTGASLAAIAILTALLLKLRDRLPEALMWFALFTVMLIPVFYFKAISYAFVAERYLYIPSFAILMMAITLLRPGSLYSRVFFWAIVAVFVLATAYRNPVWASDEQLYSSTLRVQPEVSHMRINLADIYLKRKDDATAKELLQTSLRYVDDPRFAQFPFERYRAHVGLGAISARSGNFDDARQHFETAIQIQPNGDWGYLYLGGVFLEKDKDIPHAVEYFKKAIELSPINEVARDYLGVAMVREGNYKEAVANFQEALRINPTYEDARTHLKVASGLHTP